VVKAHARRLGLDLSRLQAPESGRPAIPDLTPDLKRLRDAAASIAAAWFLLCGHNASIPIEPTLYDLLVSMPDGIKRAQCQDDYLQAQQWVGSSRKQASPCT
jgi:hypothetical protein